MNKRILGIQPLGVESRREADSVLSYSQGDSAEMEAEPEVGLSSYSSSKDRLDKDQRRRSTRDRGDSFGSTSNSTSSGVPDYSSEDEDDDGLTMRKQDVVGLGIAAEGATFRKRPTIIIPSAEITESTSLERYLLRTSDTVPVDQPGQIGCVNNRHQYSEQFASGNLLTPITVLVKCPFHSFLGPTKSYPEL